MKTLPTINVQIPQNKRQSCMDQIFSGRQPFRGIFHSKKLKNFKMRTCRDGKAVESENLYEALLNNEDIMDLITERSVSVLSQYPSKVVELDRFHYNSEYYMEIEKPVLKLQRNIEFYKFPLKGPSSMYTPLSLNNLKINPKGRMRGDFEYILKTSKNHNNWLIGNFFCYSNKA